MKILFCSPYLNTPEAIKGGMNTWGRYIMAYYKQYGKEQLNMITVSLDRSVYTATSSLFGRIRYGYSDQMKSVKEAIHWMDLEKPDVAHFCTSGGLGVIRDYLLVRAAKPIKFYWTIDDIIEHEAKLYPQDERYTQEELKEIMNL